MSLTVKHFSNLIHGKLSGDQLQAQIAELAGPDQAESADIGRVMHLWGVQYFYSWGIRGDNTPENAKYLGYLLAKDLYPDVKFTPFESYLKELLEGRARKVYA